MLNRMKQEVQKLLNNIRSPFRGILNSSDSNAGIQRHQVSGLSDETLQDVELYQHFGFTSNPPAGTNVIVVPLNGLTSHSVIIATENGNYRLAALKPGEVALYSSHGSTIVLKEGNIIDIDAKEINLNGALNAGEGGTSGATATINMPLNAKSKVTADDDVVVAGKSFNNHTHPTPAGESDKPS